MAPPPLPPSSYVPLHESPLRQVSTDTSTTTHDEPVKLEPWDHITYIPDRRKVQNLNAQVTMLFRNAYIGKLMNNTEEISPEGQKKTCRVGRTGRCEKVASIKLCQTHTRMRDGIVLSRLGTSTGPRYCSMLLKQLHCIDDSSHDHKTA